MPLIRVRTPRAGDMAVERGFDASQAILETVAKLNTSDEFMSEHKIQVRHYFDKIGGIFPNGLAFSKVNSYSYL